MENRINQVMTLDNGKKYIILHQAIYNNENYYVCNGVTEDGNDINDEFLLLHEFKDNDKLTVELVEDADLSQFILKHLNLLD